MPNGTCSIDGCDDPRYKRQWCNRHYLRWRRHGDPTAGGELRGTGAECSITGCIQPAIARRWCKLHYDRWSSHGDPLAVVKLVRHGVSAYDRVMLQSYDAPDGCRIFVGQTNHAGYGRVKVGNRSVGAHRVVLIHHEGLSEGMEAMHSCDVPACVSIAHLSWGTHAENMADAAAKDRWRRAHRKIP